MNKLILSAVLAVLALPASAIEVIIDQPADGAVISGEVEVAIRVEGGEDAAGASVELFLDGQAIGVANARPFVFFVDLGETYEAHQFVAVARTEAGEEVSTMIMSRKVEVSSTHEVELMQLYVTVRIDGQRSRRLGRGMFGVRDNGHPQRIVSFAGGEVPLAAVLLVDASLSMAGARLDAAKAGVRAFASGIESLDEVQLVVFSDRTIERTPFSSLAQVLTLGLASVEPGGGTAIADHLYEALATLEARQGRRVIILLSDGIDSHSALRMEHALWKVERSQAMVYWLRLGELGKDANDREVVGRTSRWRDLDDYAAFGRDLEELVEVSGGRILDVPDATAIPVAFAEVMTELREQYVIGYYPELVHNGRFRKVEVHVGTPGAEIRTRRGYVDD